MVPRTIASTYVQLVREYLQRAGLQAEDWVQGEPLQLLNQTPAANRGERASYVLFTDLLAQLDRTLGRPDFIVEVARPVTPRHLGVLGYLIVACDTLGEALERLDRYGRLFNDGHQMSIELVGDQIQLVWSHLGTTAGEFRYAELGSCVLAQFASDLIGHEMHMTEVGFVHGASASTACLAGFFGCPVRVGQPNNYVRFPAAYLQLGLRQPDQSLRQILEQQAEQALAHLPQTDPLIETIRQQVVRACHEGAPTLQQVAVRMHLTPRTLQRRLRELGMSFQDVLDQSRLQLCEAYLRDARIGLADVAQLLGYSDQSALTRAYRRWTGLTPLERRQQLKSLSAAVPEPLK